MLVYHPAFDSYHCLFRSIAILDVCKKCEIEKLRILDFCLLFPAAVAQFRLPQSRSAATKKIAKTVSNPYRDPINLRSSFRSLSGIQTATFSCISATGLAIVEGSVMIRSQLEIPTEISNRSAQLRAKEAVFFDHLLSQLISIPLLGPDGLKDRSGLMEHRYDTF